MGVWDETCAITNTAIRPGVEVLMIASKDSWRLKTYDFYGSIARYLDWRKNEKPRVEEYISKLTRLAEEGLVPERDMLMEESFFTVQSNSFLDPFTITFGEYDWYGWIENLEGKDDYDTIFVHEPIAKDLVYRCNQSDWILKHYGRLDAHSPVECAFAVAEFALTTRVQLQGVKLVGGQHVDSAELEAQRYRTELMKLAITANEAYLEELNYEGD